MYLLTILFYLFLLLSAWFINDRFIEGKGKPPGPWRIPIFGTMLALALRNQEPPYQMFQKLCKEFGSIVTVKFGFLWQVIVDDPATVKEILNSDAFLDKAENPFILERSFGKPYGILWGNGEGWKELRRFSFRTMRDFGFGKQKTQEMIMEEELKEFLEVLNASIKNDEVIEMTNFFNVSVFNIIWCMVAGHRFAYQDERLHTLLVRISALTKTISGSGNILMGFPAFRRLFSILPGIGRTRMEVIAALQKEIQTILEERRALGYYKEEQRDYIDVFLAEIDKIPQEKPYAYSDKQFITTIFDMFVAGSDTTAATCEYAVLFMVLYPEVQIKVQEEIDRVIGRGRFPTAEDRKSMPYTDAVLLEILRIANVTPLVVRAPTRDVDVLNYNIKKGTFVILNTFSVHLNPEIWKDPNAFRPERFLDSNGKLAANSNENLFIFGGGRRSCFGEILVKATMFTYVTTLLQNYNFSVPPSTHLLQPTNENPIFGITMCPQPFAAIVKPRPF